MPHGGDSEDPKIVSVVGEVVWVGEVASGWFGGERLELVDSGGAGGRREDQYALLPA